MIGELGAQKKEIALIGDAMNTAARILEAARETGASVLISAPYSIDRPARCLGSRRDRCADPSLRGKSASLALISLSENCSGLPAATGPI